MTGGPRPADYDAVVSEALAEDLGDRGDVTTDAVIPAGRSGTGRIVTRATGVVAGLEVAAAVFRRVDPAVAFEPRVRDGARVHEGCVVASVHGPVRALLTAERTALNLLGRMSGVATTTRAYVEAVAGTDARITDTRKTIPGLRRLDKYAVRVGGGVNHRLGLYDAAIVKDNHIAAAGSIVDAVASAREALGPRGMVVVEVDRLDQLSAALSTAADRILLDNMDPATLRAAVEAIGGRMETEASGGVTLDSVRAIAETGVDYISVGALTHSAPQLDFALDLDA